MQLLIDNNLLQAIQAGEESIYNDLFHRLQPVLVSYAKQYLLDKDISEEIVQEAFLKLWENRNNLTIGINLTAYLYKTVRNLCLNYMRHLKVTNEYAKQQTIISDEIATNFEALKDKSAERLLEAEIMERLYAAINKMPDQCRSVFTLSRLEGKTYKEIAKELDITEKTVENHINRALKITRAEMQEFLPVVLLLYPFLCQ